MTDFKINTKKINLIISLFITLVTFIILLITLGTQMLERGFMEGLGANSDFLHGILLPRYIVHGHGYFKDWSYSNTPFFFQT